MAAGAFCISIDVELAWGIWDRPSPHYFARCAERELEIVAAILALFETYNIRATWAIVSRLLDRAEPAPVASEYGSRIWFAPEVVERIRESTPTQEIGSHSYSHVYFDAAAREQIRAELEAAREVHARNELEFSSFVFPRNLLGHLDLVAASGIKVFRSTDIGWHIDARRFGRLAGRIANLGDKLVPIPPTTVVPKRHANGMVELPTSMLFLGRSGVRRLVHPAVTVWKAKLGLAAARERGETFHLWFHPSNFYDHTEVQLATLGKILRHAATMRDRGQIEVRTMNTYAAPSI
jgi:hypothetical protein